MYAFLKVPIAAWHCQGWSPDQGFRKARILAQTKLVKLLRAYYVN